MVHNAWLIDQADHKIGITYTMLHSETISGESKRQLLLPADARTPFPQPEIFSLP